MVILEPQGDTTSCVQSQMDTSAKSGPGDLVVERTSWRMRTLEEKPAITEEASVPP